ncbi:MAG: hypothetical protein ACKVOG_05595 [Rhodoglobus sp.]
MTPRTRISGLLACLTSGALIIGAVVLAQPATAAVTGAGISNITPYGGYLGNYIAPDGSRVYCIDPVLDWPSGMTGSGTVTTTLTTSWGQQLDVDVLRKFDAILSRYGQTDDPVLAAAVSAYLYGYTSGYARTYGPGFDAAMHFINGEPAVAAAFSSIWAEAENTAPPVVPAAELSIEMSNPDSGVVTIAVTPAEATGILMLEGAVVAESGEASVAVSGIDSVAITAVPLGATQYTIAATATFEAAAGPQPRVTLYETGSQQRTIRDSGPTKLQFESSARVEVSRPEVTQPAVLAETGVDASGAFGAAITLLAAGILLPLTRRVREYRPRRRVVSSRD